MSAISGPNLALLQPHAPLPLEGAPLRERRESAGVFGEMLERAVASANAQGHTGAAMGEAFAAGRLDDIHGTMLALSKADIELRYVGAVRNKIVDAFYELWRMQV